MALAQAKALIAREAKAAKVGVQFSNAETEELLCIVKARLPIGSEAWKECESDWTELMSSNPTFKARNAIALKQKF